MSFFKLELEKTSAIMTELAKDEMLEKKMEKIASQASLILTNGGKIMFMGNGGSAADSQHLAAEFVSRLYEERKALAAIALTTDSSILTAIGNDYGYEQLFARQIEAIAQDGDMLVAISTSGNSPNIIEGINAARKKNLAIIGMVGGKSCKMDDICDYLIRIPSDETPKIQECHIAIGHIFCAMVESITCFSKSSSHFFLSKP